MNPTPSRIPVSVEFSRRRRPRAWRSRGVRQQLYALKPEFCSVTFGAGGSTKRARQGRGRYLAEGVSAASHFSASAPRAHTVRPSHARPWRRRRVALRGDRPVVYGMGGEFLRQRTGGLHPPGRRVVTSTSRWRLPRGASPGQVAAERPALPPRCVPVPTRPSPSISTTRCLLPLRGRCGGIGRARAGGAGHHAHQFHAG